MVMTSGNIVLVPYGSQEEDAVFVVVGGKIILFSGPWVTNSNGLNTLICRVMDGEEMQKEDCQVQDTIK